MPVMGKNVGDGSGRTSEENRKSFKTTIGTGWDGIIRLDESVSESGAKRYRPGASGESRPHTHRFWRPVLCR